MNGFDTYQVRKQELERTRKAEAVKHLHNEAYWIEVLSCDGVFSKYRKECAEAFLRRKKDIYIEINELEDE